MDQLRKAGIWLRQHHFWVLTGVATLVAIGCWFSGASALYQDYLEDRQKIDSAFTTVQELRRQDFHANDEVNKRQALEIANQKKSVYALWQQLYDRQRADVLKWPGNLSKSFREHIETLKFADDIPINLRNHYNNYVGQHFPNLPKIVGAREMAEGEPGSSGRGAYRGSRGMEGRGGMRGYSEEGYGVTGTEGMEEDDDRYIVEWLDQQRVREDLFMPTTPTAKWIWKTQEDLWVYEALLGIIARTNKAAGADRRSNAVIREITSLEVGRPAADASGARGRILIPERPAGRAMGEGEDMEGGFRGEDSYGGREGGYPGGMENYGEGGEYSDRGGMMDPSAGDAMLFVGRYVDANGIPVSGEESPDREFKRLPIRMYLTMDQRWLPQLIAECANAPLQVEVREVRAGVAESPGGMGGGYSRGGRGSRGGMEGYSGGVGAQGEVMVPEPEPHFKPVIIQGTIFIFNPPQQDEDASSLDVAMQ